MWADAATLASLASLARTAKCAAIRRPSPFPLPSLPTALLSQALRMAINGEREQMMRGMRAAFRMLKPGGVIAVITWKHSEVCVVGKCGREGIGGGSARGRHEVRIVGRCGREGTGGGCCRYFCVLPSALLPSSPNNPSDCYSLLPSQAAPNHPSLLPHATPS